MNNSNFVVLFGRIGNDIEITDHNGFKTTNRITLFVSRNFKNKNGEYESDKIQIQATNKTAEFLQSHYAKGDSISISGSIRTDEYTDKDGNKRVAVYVAVENIDPVISRRKGGATNEATPAPATPKNEPAPQQDELGEEIDDDDDLPF